MEIVRSSLFRPLAVALLLFVSLEIIAREGNLCLADNNKTDYVITVSPDDLVGNTAAKELAEHLKLITGAEFPIIKPEQDVTSSVIAVGPAAAKVLLPDLDVSFSKLGNDGIVMKRAGANLVLTGAEGAKRGTLYAVYEFLESYAGVRWWTSKESYIPRRPHLEVPELNTVYVPKFWSREVFYRDVIARGNGIFATRCRSNGEWVKIPREYGGKCKILGHVHTFYLLLPPDKYFKKYPEWYSESKGKRICSEGSQLCLSNSEMRKELVKNALTWLRKNPDADMISISQNDRCNIKNGCECKECLALTKQEGSPSGPLIKFINQAAEDIEKEFPNVYVETLAYNYTRKPPLTLKPRKNVIIRLCSIECSFSQPLETGPQNEAFRKDIIAWNAITSRLFIWDYVTNFSNYIMPHPNMRVLAPNIRFFAEHGAVGLFAQGDNSSNCGDFTELRVWLMGHLMWNPALDEKALTKEFMDGYYGPASKPLQEYLELIHNAIESSDLRCYMLSAPWMDIRTLNQSTILFNKAMELVKDNPVLVKKVRAARMPLDYVWIKQYRLMKFIAESKGEMFQGPSDITAFCKDFIKTAHDLNVERISEHDYFKDIETNLLSSLVSNTEISVPSFCVGMPQDKWFDIQDRDFQLFGIRSHWVSLVDDDKASDKRAARMTGNHTMWPVQYNFPIDLQGFHCYAVIRCDAKPAASSTKGIAFRAGIYDRAHPKQEGTSVTAPLKLVADGKYRTYDLGICNLKDGYIWFAPVNNPDIEAVYIDRIIFVKH